MPFSRIHCVRRLRSVSVEGEAIRRSQACMAQLRRGAVEIGYPRDAADALDFCFDNETPRHKVYLGASRSPIDSVTCRAYLEFMADDGYTRPEFWLSEGWVIASQSASGGHRSIGNGMQ